MFSLPGEVGCVNKKEFEALSAAVRGYVKKF